MYEVIVLSGVSHFGFYAVRVLYNYQRNVKGGQVYVDWLDPSEKKLVSITTTHYIVC